MLNCVNYDILSPSGIEVALEETMFPVDEEDGAFIEVCALVTEGLLMRDAVVTLQTTDGTATCKSLADCDREAKHKLVPRERLDSMYACS